MVIDLPHILDKLNHIICHVSKGERFISI
jgi:hypothetical protein